MSHQSSPEPQGGSKFQTTSPQGVTVRPQSIKDHYVGSQGSDMEANSLETVKLLVDEESAAMQRASERQIQNNQLAVYLPPDELLVLIFKAVIFDALGPEPSDTSLNRLRVLASVSSRWRAVAHGTPTLWETIQGLQDPLPIVQQALKLSAGCPLNISIIQPRGHEGQHSKIQAEVVQLLQSIANHGNRWLSIDLRLISPSLIRQHLTVPAPHLHKLHLFMDSDIRGQMFDIRSAGVFGGNALQLKELSLQNVPIDRNCGLLPRLQSLTINNDNGFPIASLWEMLHLTPLLVKLDFQMDQRFDSTRAPAHLSKISFVCLQNLSMNIGSNNVHQILSLIDAPKCTTFALKSNIMHLRAWDLDWEGVVGPGRDTLRNFISQVLGTSPGLLLSKIVIAIYTERDLSSDGPDRRLRTTLLLEPSESPRRSVQLMGLDPRYEVAEAYKWVLEALKTLGVQSPALRCEVRGEFATLDSIELDRISLTMPSELFFINVQNSDLWLSSLAQARSRRWKGFVKQVWPFPQLKTIVFVGCNVNPSSILGMVRARYGQCPVPESDLEGVLPAHLETLDVGAKLLNQEEHLSTWREVMDIVGEGVLV